MLNVTEYDALTPNERYERLESQRQAYRDAEAERRFFEDEIRACWAELHPTSSNAKVVGEATPLPPVPPRSFDRTFVETFGDLADRIKGRAAIDAGPCINPFRYRDAMVSTEARPTPDTDDEHEAAATMRYGNLLDRAEKLYSDYGLEVFAPDIEWKTQPFTLDTTEVAMSIWNRLVKTYPRASTKRLRRATGRIIDRLTWGIGRLNVAWAEVEYETNVSYSDTLSIATPDEYVVKDGRSACEWLHRCEVSDADVEQFIVDPTADMTDEEKTQREADKALWIERQLAFRKTQLHQALQTWFGIVDYRTRTITTWVADESQAKGVRPVEVNVLTWIAERIDEKGSDLAGIASCHWSIKNRIAKRAKRTGEAPQRPVAPQPVTTNEPKTFVGLTPRLREKLLARCA